MKNEVERLLKGRGLEVKNNKNLTENLREWRKDRNITKADYFVFVGNVLEELLEPLYNKHHIEKFKNDIVDTYFDSMNIDILSNSDVIDTIQDIQVFCINETELMGYDNIKCNNEVFKEINLREQDPTQKEEWLKNGANGKWQKSLLPEHIKKWYKADYESCKL